jgi:tetratricopeptide (TPR) repeat protein
MADIKLFGMTLDSTIVFQIIMPILGLITIIIAYKNYRKKSSPTFQNCTFQIQAMNPNDLSKEDVVKKVSECIAKNVPEVTGAIVKDEALELSKDKLKLLNAIENKVEQYSKASGKIVKDANLLRSIGNEAYSRGNPGTAFKHFSEALSIDEELKDIRGKAIDLNNIGLVYQDWGKPEQALECFQKALEIDEELKDIR